MGMVSCVRSLRGYVEFEICGDLISRFINTCASEGCSVWGIHKCGDRFFGYTYVSEYKKIAHIARQCGVSTEIIKRKGAVFWLNRYKKRTGFFVGFMIFLLFLCGTQNFIWSVDVSGNKTITSEQVLSVMEDLGVKFGAFKRKLDLRSIEAAALARFEQFSWIAVNCMGTKIHVEVREREKAPEIVSDLEPCNLIAAKDGTVTALQVRAGQKEVKKGDVVLKGDILVNGILEDKKGNNLFKHAVGEVYAKTEVSKTVSVEIAAQHRGNLQKTKSVTSLLLFGIRLPLSFKMDIENADAVSFSKYLSAFGMMLPIGVERTEYRFYQETEIMRKQEQAKQIAQYKLAIFEKQSLSEAKILAKNCRYAIENAVLVCKADYLCEENIAKSEKIYFTPQKNEKN